LGTQGRLSQQLALDAHASPAPAHESPTQRGTPTRSNLQVSTFSQLPLQQSHEALHAIVGYLQTSPSGLQPMGLRQMPRVAGGVMEQVTGVGGCPGKPAEPQQSLSLAQVSPTWRQPLGGWQTKTPIGP
jgi:hypothetical protein